MRPLPRHLLLVLALGAAPPVLHAVDDTTPAAAPTRAGSPLVAAREHLAGQRFAAAVDELKRVNAGSNADWNNLMGYALRKLTPPDLDGAQRHYDAALRLDPRHRGALEYSGELFLMRGDLPRAEQRLAALDRLCTLPCEEYTDLKNAVARFKANGNRFVP